MDSDQDSVDDWVVLPSSSSSSSDDERVVALSSGCTTPNSASSSRADDSDSEPDRAGFPTNFLLAYAAAVADPDDPEGMYALSDAEEDKYAAAPPPSPPLPRPLSGLFHHTLAGGVAYAAFDPVAALPSGHYVGKQLVPDPAFASFGEPVAALASTRGLVCLRGTASPNAAASSYYVANPATFKRERLPPPARDHRADGEPAVVIAFDLDPRDSDPERHDHDDKPFYRHYHVVVAFPVGFDGVYAFESFSSRTWEWALGNDVADVGAIELGSGVGVLGCAFWRTAVGPFLCYEPVSRCSDLVPAPAEVMQWTYWELGEMEGTLCVTCMDERVEAVVVIRLDVTRRVDVSWALAGHFEGGCLRGRKGVKLLRSQGKAEVVMWDPSSETVVAMDIEGRTTRTIKFVPGSPYYADFIPYVRSSAAVSGTGKRAHAELSTAATNNAGPDLEAMAVDAEAY